MATRVAAADSLFTEYMRASWTEKDGFPLGRSWAMAQDTDGYVWLGSSDGLVRFDGQQFLLWQPYVTPELPDDEIITICAGRDGSLWIGYGVGGRVSRVRGGLATNFTEKNGLPAGSINALTESRDGAIWAGGSGGLSRFQDGHWNPVGSDGRMPRQAVSGLYEDRRGDIWVSGSAGIFRKRARDAVFEKMADITGRAFRIFGEDASGRIWFPDTTEGVKSLNPSSRDVSTVALGRPANGQIVLHDRHDNLWLGTYGQGLLRVHRPDVAGRRIVDQVTQKDGLTADVVWSLLEDRDGNIWVGTPGGLNRFTKRRNWLTVKTELGTELTRAVVATGDGDVWVGTNEALHRFSGSDHKRYTREDGLQGRVVNALHVDQRGTVWAATDGGLSMFADGRFASVSSPSGDAFLSISAMTSDRNGDLWLCTAGPVLRRRKGKVEAVAELGNRRGISALTDSRGVIWIGFAAGELVSYRDGQFRWYSAREGLDGGPVNAIQEGSEDTIWVRTRNGLSRLAGERFTTITARNGLPSASLGSGIVEDLDGHVWINANPGLLRVSGRDFLAAAADSSFRVRYQLFDASDGIQAAAARSGYPTSVRSSDGTIWFITGSNIAVANPKLLPARHPPPSVRIDTVRVDGHELLAAPMLELGPRPAMVQINYGALNLSAPERVRFRYRLDGFDKGWIDAETRHQAYYTNLPAGRYQFRVTADHNDNRWNEHGATIGIVIKPAFYQTRWFVGASALASGLVLLTAWRLRVRVIRTRYAAVLAERARLARDIHDTLLQSLAGIGLHLEVIAGQLEASPQWAREQLQRAGERVKTDIREARRAIWDLRPPALDRAELPSLIGEVAARATENSPVALQTVVQGTRRSIDPAVEDHLVRIAQEAVANVVHHARARHVRVELVYARRSVTLRVIDDGIGFDRLRVPANGVRGFGLSNMEQRARQVGGKFSLNSVPGAGATIEVMVSVRTQSGSEDGQ